MSYSHLTTVERAKIEMLNDLDYSIQAIAKRLKRRPSTISRELKRNRQGDSYCAAAAQEAYKEKKSHCGAKGKCTTEKVGLIQQKLNETWSPEQIEGRLFKGKLSFKTIYR